MALAIGLISQTTVALAASSGSDSEKIPLHLDAPSGSKTSIAGSSGGGLMRTVIGLVVVVVVIFGVAKVLRYIKTSREHRATGTGLQSVATLPLGNNRSVHVVRVGSDVLLLGSAEQHVTQLARYTEDEALERGLLEPPAPRKGLKAPTAALKNAASSMRGAPAVDVTAHDVSQVAVTRNGSPVSGGNGGVVGTMLDQLRARTVRK